MIRPDFREFQRLAKQGTLIPVYDVFPADLLTPISAYLRIAPEALVMRVAKRTSQMGI